MNKRGMSKIQVEGRQKASTAYSKTLNERLLELSSKEAETAASIQDSHDFKVWLAEGRLVARGQSGNSVRKGVSANIANSNWCYIKHD